MPTFKSDILAASTGKDHTPAECRREEHRDEMTESTTGDAVPSIVHPEKGKDDAKPPARTGETLDVESLEKYFEQVMWKRTNDISCGPVKSSPTSLAAVITDVEELTAHDILLAPEHGRDLQHYAGNVKLTALTSGSKTDYRAATYKKRAEMIPAVVQQVKLWNPPGRFLKLDSGTAEWVEVPDDYANVHVLQLFLRCLAEQEHGDYEANVLVPDIQDPCATEEVSESSLVETIDLLDAAVPQAPIGRKARCSTTNDSTYSAEATTTKLQADEAACDLFEAWVRHDAISQAISSSSVVSSTENLSLGSLNTTGLEAEELVKVDPITAESSSLKTLQKVATKNWRAAAVSLRDETNEEHFSSSQASSNGATLPLAAAATRSRSFGADDWQRNQNDTFSTPSAAVQDSPVDADDTDINPTDMPGNPGGWQRGKPQPIHGSGVVSRIVWQLRWGTMSEASRYYVGNQGFITDTGKEEILKYAMQHVDKALVPTLFPGLRLPTVYDDAHDYSFAEEAGPQTQSCIITKITVNDVLCSCQSGEGNTRFEAMIEARKEEFASCVPWQRRLTISRELVGQWRAQDPPGRFLERRGSDPTRGGPDVWYDIGDAKARIKTSHLLRRSLRSPLQRALGYTRASDGAGGENPDFDVDADELSPEAVRLAKMRVRRTERLANQTRGRSRLDLEILESGYDEAVVAVAMYNYESFYHLSRGTAEFTTVATTSAGIEGWAACTIPEDSPPLQRDCTSADTPEMDVTAAPLQPRRRDPEEDRQLQIALLESVGACPNRLQNCSYEYASDSSCTSEGEWSDYQYEGEEEEEEEEEEGKPHGMDDPREEEKKVSEDSHEQENDPSITSSCNFPEISTEFHDIWNNSHELAMRQEKCLLDVSLVNHDSNGVQASTSGRDSDSWSKISSATSDFSGTVLVASAHGDEISHQSNQSD